MRFQISLTGLSSSRARRAATLLPLALLLTLLSGDRSVQAIVERGIDPLEVLNLYVRPNVIIVLDASGSMTGTVGLDETFTGDHPRSRMGQAKQVIRDVVELYQSKVNFQMGAYTQQSPALQNASPVLASGHGSYRFQYTTLTEDYPSAVDDQMETGELTVMGDLGRTLPDTTPCVLNGDTACDGKERGLQSWQIVPPGGNQLVFEEGGVSCTVTVTPAKKFYRVGGPPAAVPGGAPAGTLAADIEAAMNGCAGRPGTPPNVYRVSYAANTGIFTIRRDSGPNNWRPRWSQSTIRGRFGSPADPTTGAGPFSTAQPYMLLIRRPGAIDPVNRVPPVRAWGRHWRIVEPGMGNPARTITSHQLYAGAYFNGEVVRVDSRGTVCDVQFPVAPLPVPAKVTLQQVGLDCAGGDIGTPVDFTLGGGRMTFNQSPANCAGYTEGAGLRPCDQSPGNTQLDAILPVIDREVPVSADGTLTSYSENPATLVASLPPATVGGARASGNTPIANSLQDIKTNFNLLWASGQVACPAGPPSPLAYKWDVQHCPDRVPPAGSDPTYVRLALDPIRDHVDPKERTIVLFVTDGDDTCSGSGDTAALAAAARAQALYTPIVATEPASSVQTYVLGFGNGATPNRLNWIAWGGSGLVKAGNPWSSTPSPAEVAACKARGECQDAFIAPDAETLAGYLQGIINQGAASGEFVAQTPLFPNIFERVGSIPGTPVSPVEPYHANNPETRYKGFAQSRIQTSFVLPGFKGKVASYVNVAGSSVQLWEAGSKMVTGSSTFGFRFTGCATSGQCTFAELTGGASDLNIASSAAAIKRRVYTSSRNGVFPVTTANLVDVSWMRNQGGASRTTLWPPSAAVAPADYATEGSLDAALGLPTTTLTATVLSDLQTKYGACRGLNLPTECGTTQPIATQVRAARREARQSILAYMAGAEWVVNTDGNPKRYPSTSPAAQRYQIMYAPRNAPLADATYGTPAVVGVPGQAEPSVYTNEYRRYRDGGVDSSGAKTDGILQGFGLRNPDLNDTICPAGPSCTQDTRANLKPRMSVVFVGANDMLHAFRAGCSDPSNAACYGTPGAGDAGEELWGYVPFDQLGKLGLRLQHRPARRSPHDYMISTGLRFSDVFVPGPLAASAGAPTSLGSLGVGPLTGLWRKVLLFGRGQEGKYLTALDVTAPGPFTAQTLATMGPLVLWNRGNPDTQDGTPTGAPNNTLTTGDFDGYKLMGETWSVPTISLVNRLGTARSPCSDGTFGNAASGTSRLCSDPAVGGVEFVSFVGSGYGDDGGGTPTREGYALFTLDTLTGDIVAYADVEAAAAAVGWDRTGLPYRNAIVADPSAFAHNQLVGLTGHPAAAPVVRVYVGDLYGRAWKFVSAAPHVAIPFADLGADQPVAVGAALIEPDRTGLPGHIPNQPHIYMIAGNETRAADTSPFKLFGLWDEKTDDTDTSQPVSPLLFTRELLPQGPGTRSFRGTLPPVTFFNTAHEARVVFGATRFNPPGSPDAPPVPPYPCRSSFDSVVYGLRAESGTGPYSLPDDGGAAQFIQGVRILSVAAIPDPVTGQGTVQPVAGQVTSVPAPPAGGAAPLPGITVSVIPDKKSPAPMLFRNASSVCSN